MAYSLSRKRSDSFIRANVWFACKLHAAAEVSVDLGQRPRARLELTSDLYNEIGIGADHWKLALTETLEQRQIRYRRRELVTEEAAANDSLGVIEFDT